MFVLIGLLRVVVARFDADQGAWDHAVDGFGAGEADEGAGDFAHEAGCAAAVDELDVMFVEFVGEGAGDFEVGWVVAGDGAAADCY